MTTPEIPNDASELIEASFADDVEAFSAIDGMYDDELHDSEGFADKVMERIHLEDLYDEE